MLDSSSNTLVAMASELSEVQDRQNNFSSPSFFNNVQSMQEAKTLLQYMFSIVLDARLYTIYFAT
jgi:kinesin family protein 4/21/27